MAGKSNIEWTGHTWNALAGCSILTPGCTNCYAMKMAARLDSIGHKLYSGLTAPSKSGPVWTGVIRQAPEHVLLAPLKRKKPTVYFVNSMSDLFHEDCPDEWIDRVFAVMALSSQHTFQVLTKRAERMLRYLHSEMVSVRWATIAKGMAIGGVLPRDAMFQIKWPLPNVWLGVSTERQQEADERIPLLLQTPAAIRFISAEPLIGAINLEKIVESNGSWGSVLEPAEIHGGAGQCVGLTPALDWVIVGGESGPGARPMNPQWAISLRDQCLRADIPFFFKQWGSHVPETRGRYRKVARSVAGRLLDGVEHNAMPGRAA